MRTISCAHLIADAERPPLVSQKIVIDADRIASVAPTPDGKSEPLLVMPALVNAHDHGRAVRTSSIGAAGKPLEAWLNYLALFPSVDPYLAALVSLGRSALGGAGTIMMHYTRAQGFTDLPTEVANVARAASDVGVRVGFAVSMKDRNPLVYGPSEPILAALPAEARAEIERRFLATPRRPAEFIALVDAVAAAAANPKFDVQYGPNGVQWCSDALLEAVADASQRTGRRIHMHLLETRYQRQWLDRAYPNGVVNHLDQIGFLSPRLTLAHCVWARPDELELLGARGVTIAVNNSSNLHLHSGVAPIPKMLRCGCRVALGIDAYALDDDDDSVREMRLAKLLNQGTGFRIDLDRRRALHLAFGEGRRSVTNSPEKSAIEAGAPADLTVFDWAALDDDRLRTDIDPLDILFSRASARHIKEVIVAGETIVRDGRLLGADYEAAYLEVIARMRAGMAANTGLAAALSALDRAVVHQYEPDYPCC